MAHRERYARLYWPDDAGRIMQLWRRCYKTLGQTHLLSKMSELGCYFSNMRVTWRLYSDINNSTALSDLIRGRGSCGTFTCPYTLWLVIIIAFARLDLLIKGFMSLLSHIGQYKYYVIEGRSEIWCYLFITISSMEQSSFNVTRLETCLRIHLNGPCALAL